MKTFATPTRQRSGTRVPSRGPVSRGVRVNVARRAEIRHILHGPRIQSELRSGAPHDVCQREADLVGDGVVELPEPGRRVHRLWTGEKENLPRDVPASVRRIEVTADRAGMIRCYGYYGYAGYGYYPYLFGGEDGHPCPSEAATEPDDYCEPFDTRAEALTDRDSPPWWAPGGASKGVLVLAGATAAAGGSGVAALLYAKFIYGGSGSVEDASAGAAEFTQHATTVFVTKKILADVLDGLTHARESVFATFQANPQAHLDLPVTATQRSGVDDQSSDYALNFCGLNLPGVIAGGVGKTQTGPGNLGADTSAAQNDFRDVQGSLRVTADPRGPAEVRLTVSPSLAYHVTDTVDFCPGNPGGFFAQTLTVPLSRWEASGISGDVTFELDFATPPITAGITLERVNGVVVARDESMSGP